MDTWRKKQVFAEKYMEVSCLTVLTASEWIAASNGANFQIAWWDEKITFYQFFFLYFFFTIFFLFFFLRITQWSCLKLANSWIMQYCLVFPLYLVLSICTSLPLTCGINLLNSCSTVNLTKKKLHQDYLNVVFYSPTFA